MRRLELCSDYIILEKTIILHFNFKMGKRKHMVWQVDHNGNIVREMALTDAGRSVVDEIPDTDPRKAKLRTDGSYQSLLKPFLDRNIMVDDSLRKVESTGYFWMSVPSEPFSNRMRAVVSDVEELKEKNSELLAEIMELKEKNSELLAEIMELKEKNSELLEARTNDDEVPKLKDEIVTLQENYRVVKDKLDSIMLLLAIKSNV